METTKAAAILSALGHEKRLELYRLLFKRGPQGWSAGVLAQKLDIAPPILSFHAKALEHAGLIQSRSEGRHNIYTANIGAMTALVDYLTAECCAHAEGAGVQCIPVATIRRRRQSA